MRLDPRKVQFPAQMLAIDSADISNEECILITNLAGVSIYAVHTLFESLTDQVLCIVQSMILVFVKIVDVVVTQ